MIKIGERTIHHTRTGREQYMEVIAIHPEAGREYVVLAPVTKRGASKHMPSWVYINIASAEKLEVIPPKQFQQHEYVIIDAAMNVFRSSEYAGHVAVWGGRSGWSCVAGLAQHYKTWATATRAHANVAKRVPSCMIVTVEEYTERRVAALEALGLA
jgi:hypothetical protein